MQKLAQVFTCLVLILASGSSCPEIKTQRQCGDFLAEFSKKPKHIIFLDCQETNDAQIKVLKASYKVSGKDAAETEAYLQRYFQMPKLSFVCCGWETGRDQGKYKNDQGFDYQIYMFSEETLINDRNDWGKIPFFYISVILPLEEV